MPISAFEYFAPTGSRARTERFTKAGDLRGATLPNSGVFIYLRRAAASGDVWREECPSLVSLKCLDACLARLAS